jgi:hypothetical protein
MKKSFMLFVAFCGVIALLVAPGIAVADTFELTAFRDFSLFNQIVLNVVDPSNVVQAQDPDVVSYTPLPGQPGYVLPSFGLPGVEHNYIINFPGIIGGQCQDVPGLSPITGYSGLLVLTYPNTSVTLPTDLNGWLADLQDPTFLSKVSAIVAFVPGVSTAVVYENCTPPPQVPEPGVLLLLSSGLVALAGMRRVIKK